MSANFMYSNTALSSLIPHQQQQHIVTQRSRSASTSNAGPNVHTQYQVALSQPYQNLGPMDGSWTQTQGMYVNGLNKMINVFPGQSMTDMEQTPISQSSENYKYAPNIKLNELNSRSCTHSFQPSNGNTGGNHGSITLGAQQVHFAVAATPNGLVQPHTGLQNPSTSIRSEQTGVLHPNAQHPSGSLGQPFLIPGIVGQPTIRTLTQDNLSPAYRESGSTQPLLTSGSKQVNNLNTNNARDLHPRILDVNVSMNQSAYVPSVPVQQHPVVSHHQLYTSPTLQPPSLHGMVEYVQAVYPTNPNVHVPYTQQSATLFGHYPAQMNTGFDSTMNTNFNSRIRHNTWAGLEDNISSAINHDSSARKIKNEKVLVPNDFPSTVNDYNLNSHGSFTQYTATPYFSGFNQSSFYQTDGQKPDISKLPGSVTFHHGETQKHPCSYQNPASLQFNSSSAMTNKVDFPSNDVSYMTSVPVGQLPSRSNYQVHNNSYLSSVPSCIPVQSNNNYIGSNNNHTVSSHAYVFNSDNSKTLQQSVYPTKDNYPRTIHKPREWNKSKDSIHYKPPSSSHHSRLNNTKSRNIKNFSSDKQAGFNDRKPASSSINDRLTQTEKNTNSFTVQTTSSFLSSGSQGLISSLSTANQDFNPNHQLNTKPVHFDYPQAYTNVHGTVNQTNEQCVGGPLKHLQNYQPSLANNNLLSSYVQGLPENLIASLKLSGFRLVLDSCPTRLLLSTSLVGSIIGRGGRTIRQITTKTGAKIGMKQDIITFSQFSLPGKGKKTFKSSDSNGTNHIASTNHFREEEGEKEETCQPPDSKDTFTNVNDNTKVDQPSETCPNTNTESILTNKSQSSLEVQSDESQLAILFGSREQCSAALCEILTICFRESKHRGFSDPCLGLLVEQHIYAQLIMNKGKKYFNAIHTATGARISVTGTPLQIRPSSDNEQCNLAPTDRVLVVRGQLHSICAAEAFLSEQIRWATIESSIPTNFWPLLNHLPPLPMNNNNNNNRSSKSSNLSFSYDPQSVCSLIMSLGSIFWPQSVCAKLGKNNNFQYYNKRSLIRSVTTPKIDNTPSKNISGNIENDNNVDNENDPNKQDQDKNINDDDHSDNLKTINDSDEKNGINLKTKDSIDNTLNHSSMNTELSVDGGDEEEGEDQDQEEIHNLTIGSIVSSDYEQDKNESTVVLEMSDENKETELHLPSNNCIDSEMQKSDKLDQLKPDQYAFERLTRSTNPKETNPTMVTAVQQSLIAAVGPIAWLATGGMLYMRVSYNEAGALIGSEGSRIQQLMQATGAEIHVGKVPISPPYALNPTPSKRTDSNNNNNNNVQSNEKSPTCISLVDSFFNDDTVTTINCDSSSNVNNKIDQSLSKINNDNIDDNTTDNNHIDANQSINIINDQLSSMDINETNDDEEEEEGDSTKQQPNDDGVNEETICTNKVSLVDNECTQMISSMNNDTHINDIAADQTSDMISNCYNHHLVKSSSIHSDCTVVEKMPDHQISESIEQKTSNITTTTTTVTSTSNQSYRLVSLSGSAQSQIMAQWQIFQRLKNLHKRQMITGSSSNDNSNQKLFCLATLICLPYRFLWWLTTHNPGFIETSRSSSVLTSTVFSKFDDSGNTNNNNKSGTSPLNWIQSLASRRLNANLSSNDAVKKFIHVLPEPRRRKRLVQQQLKRINATLRGQQQQLNYTGGNCLSKSLILPPRELTNDGLDQLWAHPNRIPLEIYADFETTQLILTNLHHMLALWLYGQSLAGTSVQSFIQAPIVYVLPNGRPTNISTSDSANGRPYSKSNRHNTDQPDYWTLMPGRQDAFLNSLRQPFHIPLFPGGIPNFGSSTAGAPNYSTPMLPDRSNCTNLAQPFFYPRYPLINWHGIANSKYSGQTMTSDPTTTRPVRIGPPTLYGCWPRGRLSDTIDDKHNIEIDQSCSPSTRFPSAGPCYTFIANLPFPPPRRNKEDLVVGGDS
ncbi:unnamed protein product [Schistosoma rodhaini]|uniref:K Homology domain-containing protein n=1 Tax=Schistosoma rodhaini TaxID=6188 RepID=A0AA85GL05_9TREM|nr:unnamed protein product [Schistosoma rodhaini]CAH8655297.1 unnamed protein product [Schistosoma rodhaini]